MFEPDPTPYGVTPEALGGASHCEVNPLNKRACDDHGARDDAGSGSPEKDPILAKKGAFAPGEGVFAPYPTP